MSDKIMPAEDACKLLGQILESWRGEVAFLCAKAIFALGGKVQYAVGAPATVWMDADTVMHIKPGMHMRLKPTLKKVWWGKEEAMQHIGQLWRTKGDTTIRIIGFRQGQLIGLETPSDMTYWNSWKDNEWCVPVTPDPSKWQWHDCATEVEEP